MVDIIIFVVVIAVAMRLIYFGVQYILNLLFGKNNKNWITQHYRRHSEVDLKKITRITMTKSFPKDDCTHWEMVAIFGSYLLENTVMEVLSIAQSFGKQGWDKKYNYDFFKELERTALTISRRRHKKKTRELLRFAQGLAQGKNEQEWEDRYKILLSREHADQTKTEWDTSRLRQ